MWTESFQLVYNLYPKISKIVYLKFWAVYYIPFYKVHHGDLMNEVSGESWQLVTTVHDEGDGPILCE
jgi:hypothetical protein